MSDQADLPSPSPVELTYLLSERSVAFNVDESVFSLDAVYGAAYLFVDRCWVFFTRPQEGVVGVNLKSKANEVTEGELDALAGEFSNELLNQAIRVQLGESTATLREYMMARAFFTTPVQSSIDALLAELDAEELEEDDLEISVPWEDAGA